MRASRSMASGGSEVEGLGEVRPDLTGPNAGATDRTRSDRSAGPVAAPHAEAAVSGGGEQSGEPGPPTTTSWLGEAVVNGLIHCACSHLTVHPDLLPLPNGETAAATAPRAAAGDDDAG